MKDLNISRDLKLPLEAVTEKLAFLGRTSGGKTYAATKLAEEMLEAGAHIVALDPVGKWHGLRLAKDGKGKGYPIPVFGGLYGDLPLEHTAGVLVADLIVDKKINAVIDLSQFLPHELTRFTYEFGTRLYQRLKAEPSALHLFMEECQEMIPQNPMGGSGKDVYETRMLHAYTRIWKLGRNCGIGGSLISQRPQEINKKVLNMSECLFVFQMTGPQEKKAVADWVGQKGLDANLDEVLPYLKQGDCHVWSPVFLKRSEVIHILEKRTFDASATPKVGAKIVTPRELSPIDVVEISKAMTQVVERAKENDPRELKRRISELERKLKAQPGPVDSKAIEAAVAHATEQIQRETDRRVKTVEDHYSRQIRELTDRLQRIAALAAVSGNATPPTSADRSIPATVTTQPTRVGSDRAETESWFKSPAQPAGPRPVQIRTSSVAGSNGDRQVRAGGLRRILTALGQYPGGVTDRRLAALTGLSRKGGTFRTYLGKARTEGWATRTNPIQITQAGLDVLGEFEPLPTGQELIEMWRRELGDSGMRRMFDVIVDHYPGSISPNELSEATGMRREGGTFRTYLGKLRSLELVSRGEIRASDELFE